MAEAPDPDDPNIFFKDADKKLTRDTSFDEEELEGEEKKVADETQKIFRTFLFTRLTSDIERETEGGDLTVGDISPTIVHNIRDEKEKIEQMKKEDEKMVEIGRVLAALGDQVSDKYKDELASVVSGLNINEELAFDTFANVTRKLFNNGVGLGRIIALFLFGYEIARTYIRNGLTGVKSFLRKILKYIVGVFFKENLLSWIIEQGGWLNIKLQENDNWLYGLAAILITIACSFGVYKITRGDTS